jgi:hypothetical protein
MELYVGLYISNVAYAATQNLYKSLINISEIYFCNDFFSILPLMLHSKKTILFLSWKIMFSNANHGK